MFQPDRGEWSSCRCRSAPTPSGAPVSSMSKKSAFTPATALSARSHCVSGARERIAVPLTWSRTSPGSSSRAVRRCTCTGPCCSNRVHREYSRPGATVQPTSSVSSAPSRERRWAVSVRSARFGPRTPSELCTVGPGEVLEASATWSSTGTVSAGWVRDVTSSSDAVANPRIPLSTAQPNPGRTGPAVGHGSHDGSSGAAWTGPLAVTAARLSRASLNLTRPAIVGMYAAPSGPR